MCESGVCRGITATNPKGLCGLGVANDKCNIAAECENSSGCGYTSIDIDKGQQVCCNIGKAVTLVGDNIKEKYKNKSFCPVMKDGEACLSNEMCISKTCSGIDSNTGIGRCGVIGKGSVCVSDRECGSTGKCGIQNLLDTTKPTVCCNTDKVVTIDGKNYCADQELNSPCISNLMCKENETFCFRDSDNPKIGKCKLPTDDLKKQYKILDNAYTNIEKLKEEYIQIPPINKLDFLNIANSNIYQKKVDIILQMKQENNLIKQATEQIKKLIFPDGTFDIENQTEDITLLNNDGEKCINNNECSSNFCRNGICGYIPDGEKCNNIQLTTSSVVSDDNPNYINDLEDVSKQQIYCSSNACGQMNTDNYRCCKNGMFDKYYCGNLENNEKCRWDGQCKTDACGYVRSTDDYRCCENGSEVYGAKDYCKKVLNKGAVCKYDIECKSDSCKGNGYGTSLGICE